MPVYPYKCPYCNHTFEVIRKFSDEGIEYCPECSERLTKENRLVANTSFKLEGDGWYKDGYGGKEAAKYSWQK